jgi:hypothetical protein
MGQSQSKKPELWYGNTCIPWDKKTYKQIYSKKEWNKLKYKLAKLLNINKNNLILTCRTPDNHWVTGPDDHIRINMNMGATHLFIDKNAVL